MTDTINRQLALAELADQLDEEGQRVFYTHLEETMGIIGELERQRAESAEWERLAKEVVKGRVRDFLRGLGILAMMWTLIAVVLLW